MLSGKIALITGGSRGIGRAIALSMAQAGADVAILYAGRQDAALEVVGAIQALGRKAQAYQCDVSSFDQTGEVAAQVLQDFGRVDILVNNAGITADTLIMRMKEEQFDQVIDTNLKGAFHLIRHLIAPMMRQRAGRILNISSVVGILGNAGQANYAASKAGLIGLSKSVAREAASRGITCNVIAPGFIRTDMTDALPEKAAEAALSRIPLGRMGEAADIAALAVFLCSDAASYITGEVIKVDGGMGM